MIKKNMFLVLSMVVLIGCGSSDSNNTNASSSSNGFEIEDLEKTESISIELKKSLAYMGNEERLAFEVYNEFYKKYPDVKQFTNIATKSEIKHIEAVQDLIQRYEITGTELMDSNYTSLGNQNKDISEMKAGEFGVLYVQNLYNDLIVAGDSKVNALKAACKVEVIDIDDLDKYLVIANDENASDIVSAFEFLRQGSYKHYWRFDQALKNENITNGCNLEEDGFGDKTSSYPNS